MRLEAMLGTVLAWSCCARATAHAAADDDAALEDMTLEQLLEVTVTTASKVEEKLSEAPATVIIVTGAELERRGYRQLADLFDDLPGMDVVRPYGDTWVLTYWRGYRSDQTEPYLLLVDGVIANSLYTDDVEGPIEALPLSNIDRVEIVFGPASSVYGPSAFMGVVNVITRSDADRDGVSQRLRVTFGSSGERVADGTIFYKRGTVRASLTARFEVGDLDDSTRDLYEYTRDGYYADRRLWGGFVDNPNLGGRFASSHQGVAVDGRVFVDDLELGARYLEFASGYGVQYAGDRVQNQASWKRRQISVHVRHRARYGDHVRASTLVHYRQGGVPNESYYVDGYEDPVAGHVAAFSYWQSRNQGLAVYEDVELDPAPWLKLSAGAKYERKDLQKAYEITGEGAAGTPGGYEPVDTIGADTYVFPDPPAPSDRPENRIATEDLGAYAQGRVRIAAGQLLFLGARVDRNSGYKYAPTVRTGWVGTFGRIGLKALYGQAFKEPSPRVLFGGWTGAGSDPDLRPERGQTLEASATHSLPGLVTAIDAYYVQTTDTIMTGVPARNLGTRDLIGLEYSARTQVALPRALRLEGYASYTRVLLAQEDVLDDATGAYHKERIGDLASNKLQLGASLLRGPASITLRGRYLGDRRTTPSNPVAVVDGFVTIDLSAEVRDVRGTGLGVGVLAQNLGNAHYVHPGINEASAGVTPGTFAADGTYTGSAGYFSSLMPQPGRALFLSVWLER
jgi:outer membrane receptor for ferrienterochelin and colicins